MSNFGDRRTGASAALTQGTWTSYSTWRACKRCYVDAELRFTNSWPCMYEGWDPRYEGDVALEGGVIDFVAAAKYYGLCCYADSANALARMYEEGRGVVQNFDEAERLLKISADDGCHEAIFRLACMYEDGRRLGQDFDMAAELCVRRNFHARPTNRFLKHSASLASCCCFPPFWPPCTR